MSEKIILDRRESKNMKIRVSIDKILNESKLFLNNNFNDLKIGDYIYSEKEALRELGLDSELVHQLVEDYVIQILKSKTTFIQYIQKMKSDENNKLQLNYTPIRELAHKNLGVARNLRIEDGIKVLDKLMVEKDIDYLILCVDALECCAIRLKPKCAYDTLRLIDVKSSM